MTALPAWQYDEMKFSGVDFSRVEEVAAYDAMHRKFYFDIVFPSNTDRQPEKIDEWIAAIGKLADARLAEEAVIHVKSEFSTYDWILEGMLRRSGFHIDAAEYNAGFQATYLCTKK
jgi:hypothetical protein